MNDKGFRGTLEGIWRIEAARVIAGVARLTRDLALAEDCAQDALLAALEHWPEDGIPDRPGAWLLTTARHRALDQLRRNPLLERKHRELAAELEARREMSESECRDTVDSALDEEIGDDLLRLIFTACHPLLAPEARVALTLRLLGGLTTDEIARAFLAREPTIAQRIVRAKRTLTAAQVPFEVPRSPDFGERLDSVLEVIYLIFNEGYAATRGEDWARPDLCHEALRLGRILAELIPREPEVHGLVALLEIQSSRLPARTGPDGEPVLLLEQDRNRWDRLLIRRGLAALQRAQVVGEQTDTPLGPYAVQAAIAACHARAATPESTDWPQIAALYDALVHLVPSPVVALNRAVAVAMAFGADAGLEIVDTLTAEPALQNYHYLPSVRGDLLFKLGRFTEAQTEFSRAASMTTNTQEKRLLLSRARVCGQLQPPAG
jgi:RNA polymerase sigma factor (sigma-70 family)